MKKLFVIVLVFFILLFTLPLVLLKGCEKNKIDSENASDDYGKFVKTIGKLSINVYDTQKKQVVEMDLEDYVLGVAAGEMPSSFHVEALKAQCLASRTYAVLRMTKFGGKGCVKHPGADVCTDPAHCQAHVNFNIAEKELGIYKSAVEATAGEVIVYQDNLIDAVFHSTSGGKTENSEEIWSAKIPYLRSVVSEFEVHSPKLATSCEIKNTDFVQKIKNLDKNVNINSKQLRNQIEILERSEGGRVKRIKIGNKVFDGETVKTALGLNSSNFNIAFNQDSLHFTVTGYGHGVGMSQYGADGMGKSGYSYVDIIKHYYKDVEIININYDLGFENKYTNKDGVAHIDTKTK